MKMGRILAVILILAAFAGGMMIGKGEREKGVPVVVETAGGGPADV